MGRACKIGNALRKVAHTCSNFLAFTILWSDSVTLDVATSKEKPIDFLNF
jgi:hypothetical protein